MRDNGNGSRHPFQRRITESPRSGSVQQPDLSNSLGLDSKNDEAKYFLTISFALNCEAVYEFPHPVSIHSEEQHGRDPFLY